MPQNPTRSKRLEIPDGTVTGLYLVVQSSGARSWAVRYRHHGRPTKLTLGPYPRLGLGEAREARPGNAGYRQRRATDPTADRVTMARLKRLPAADNARTFEAVLDRFIAAQKAKGRRVGRQRRRHFSTRTRPPSGGGGRSRTSPQPTLSSGSRPWSDAARR